MTYFILFLIYAVTFVVVHCANNNVTIKPYVFKQWTCEKDSTCTRAKIDIQLQDEYVWVNQNNSTTCYHPSQDMKMCTRREFRCENGKTYEFIMTGCEFVLPVTEENLVVGHGSGFIHGIYLTIIFILIMCGVGYWLSVRERKPKGDKKTSKKYVFQTAPIFRRKNTKKDSGIEEKQRQQDHQVTVHAENTPAADETTAVNFGAGCSKEAVI